MPSSWIQNPHQLFVFRALSDMVYIYSLVMKYQTDKVNRSPNIIDILLFYNQLKMYRRLVFDYQERRLMTFQQLTMST